MSIDKHTDLGERKVFEGPEADAMIVRLVLEREGIDVVLQPAHTVLARLHGAVYVADPAQVSAARAIVRRHVNGARAAIRDGRRR